MGLEVLVRRLALEFPLAVSGIRFGNRLRTAATVETTGCGPASHRAADLQPRSRLRVDLPVPHPLQPAPEVPNVPQERAGLVADGLEVAIHQETSKVIVLQPVVKKCLAEYAARASA